MLPEKSHVRDGVFAASRRSLKLSRTTEGIFRQLGRRVTNRGSTRRTHILSPGELPRKCTQIPFGRNWVLTVVEKFLSRRAKPTGIFETLFTVSPPEIKSLTRSALPLSLALRNFHLLSYESVTSSMIADRTGPEQKRSNSSAVSKQATDNSIFRTEEPP